MSVLTYTFSSDYGLSEIGGASAVKRRLQWMAAVMEIIMDITLVTSSFNDEVHGSDNDKRTGCGINLLKPENVTRFRRSGVMTDLKDITCEKCKAVLAKKIIRADKKEMSKLIKEEKFRAKKGIEDDGIVPLGNTTAKITKDPNEEEKMRAAAKAAAEERRAALKAAEEEEKAREEATRAKRAAEEAERAAREAEEQARLEAQKSIPGTGIAMDDSLAQFAINVPDAGPQYEEEAPAPVNAAPVPQDDFLAQFAVQKPQEEKPADDFLAQFAIPSPEQQPTQPEMYAEPAPVSGGYGSDTIVDVNSEDDIMKMFSLDGQQPAYGQPDYSQPAYSQPAYGEAPVDTYENAPAAPDMYAEPQYQQPAEEYPAENYQEPEVDLSTVSEWDMVADQIFGYENAPQPEGAYPAESTEMDELPMGDVAGMQPAGYAEQPAYEAAPAYEEQPAFDEIPAVETQPVPAFDEVPAYEEQPAFDEIPAYEEQPAPVFDEIPAVEAQPAPAYNGTPVYPNITPVYPVPQAPVFNNMPVFPVQQPQGGYDINSAAENEIKENGEENMDKYRYSTPDFADETNKTQQTAPNAAEQIVNVPQLAGYDVSGQPIYTYIQMKMQGYDANGQPILVPLQSAAPAQQRPAAPAQAAAPVQQRPVAPAQTAAPAQQRPVAPAQAAAPAQQRPVAPAQAATPAQQRPAAPAQAAAPAQQRPVAPAQAAVPVQQRPVAPAQTAAPAQPSIPRKPAPANPNAPYKKPTANISKIAVNPHSKATSQAFINAIASSKDYADKNLIETQGLQANAPLLTSVEDVLSQMGDESAKRKLQQAAVASKNVPVYDEYKASAPVRNAHVPRKVAQEEDIRFMSKSELKAKKKQDKIDAKFKKEMSKRGF